MFRQQPSSGRQLADIVLITGGTGYLGGRIVRALTNHHQVRLTSRHASRDKASHSNIIPMDLSTDDPLPACEGVDTIIHLAALNAADSAADPEAAIAVNIRGTHRLMKAAERAGVRRLIYMSTAHVYGTPLIGELKETDPTRPATPYAWTHRTAEDLVLASRLVEGVVLRLSNVIGSPADISADCWSLIANDLCRQAVQHQSLSLRGNGRDVRDIIGITDVTRCVAFLLDRPPASLGDGLYNLGGRRTMTMRDLAGMIADRAQRLLGTEIPVHIGPGDGQSPVLVYKVDKLAALGFTPAATLDREIDEMLDFCIRHFSPADAKP